MGIKKQDGQKAADKKKLSEPMLAEARKVKTLFEAFEKLGRQATANAIEIGRRLIRVRKGLVGTQWYSWLRAAGLFGREKTVRRYCLLAQVANQQPDSLSGLTLTEAYLKAGIVKEAQESDTPPATPPTPPIILPAPPSAKKGNQSRTKLGDPPKIPTPTIVWRRFEGKANVEILSSADIQLQLGSLLADPDLEKALKIGLVIFLKGGAE